MTRPGHTARPAVLAALLLCALLAPLLLAVRSRNIAWLLLPTLLLLLPVIAQLVLLRHAHGTLLDLWTGQFEPTPRSLDPRLHLQQEQTYPPHSVRVTLRLDRPIAHTSGSYLSFALPVSQIADRAQNRSGAAGGPSIDLSGCRLDMLTRALAPAYLRLGGVGSDATYYDLYSAGPASAAPPPGYGLVLTRARWRELHEFARRNELEVAFSLNAGPSSRKANRAWDPSNAADWMAHTAHQGYPVAIWALGQEMNLFFVRYGLGAHVPVAQYRTDLAVARRLVERYSPGSRLAAQGSAFMPILGEPLSPIYGYLPRLLRLAGQLVDVVNWHYYPQQARHLPAATRRAFPSQLLSPRHLDETAFWGQKVAAWRDRYAPGKALWLGGTGHALGGGEPGLSDRYLSGLWWLDQLGQMARLGHEVIVRQSLLGSGESLIDETTLEPRPDYWNSLLWKRCMGSQVYAVELDGEGAENIRVYAHSPPPGQEGPASVLAINLDPRSMAVLSFPDLEGNGYEVLRLSAPDLLGTRLLLNGTELMLQNGALPDLRGQSQDALDVPMLGLLPLSYAFVVFASC